MTGPAQEGAEVQQFRFKKNEHLLALHRAQPIQKAKMTTAANIYATMEK